MSGLPEVLTPRGLKGNVWFCWMILCILEDIYHRKLRRDTSARTLCLTLPCFLPLGADGVSVVYALPSLQKSEVTVQPRVRGAVQTGVAVPRPCGEAQRKQGETTLERNVVGGPLLSRNIVSSVKMVESLGDIGV